MPDEKKDEEPLVLYAHKKATELANQQYPDAIPYGRQQLWLTVYWTVMHGYGFVPYRIR